MSERSRVREEMRRRMEEDSRMREAGIYPGTGMAAYFDALARTGYRGILSDSTPPGTRYGSYPFQAIDEATHPLMEHYIGKARNWLSGGGNPMRPGDPILRLIAGGGPSGGTSGEGGSYPLAGLTRPESLEERRVGYERGNPPKGPPKRTLAETGKHIDDIFAGLREPAKSPYSSQDVPYRPPAAPGSKSKKIYDMLDRFDEAEMSKLTDPDYSPTPRSKTMRGIMKLDTMKEQALWNLRRRYRDFIGKFKTPGGRSLVAGKAGKLLPLALMFGMGKSSGPDPYAGMRESTRRQGQPADSAQRAAQEAVNHAASLRRLKELQAYYQTVSGR
jgi:hypothetical protein